MNLNHIAKKPFWDLFYKTPCMSQLIRLAFNDAIRYNARDKTGGADASIRFDNALNRVENTGLNFAMKQILFAKTDGNHITNMLSLSDLIQLGAYAALEY
jgi:catalase (peroxidase I)